MRRCVRVLFSCVLVSATAKGLVSCGGSAGSPLFDTADGAASNADATTQGDAAEPVPAQDAGVDAADAADGPVVIPVPPYDGVCTPGAMGTTVYDPDCVYVIGRMPRLSGTACHDRAMLHPSNPNDRVFGFGCNLYHRFIRPTDGRMVFESSANSAPQAYVYRSAVPDGLFDWQQLAAQERAATPPCDSLFGNSLYVFPDDGALFYMCNTGDGEYHLRGVDRVRMYHMGRYSPIALGEKRTLLVAAYQNDLLIVVLEEKLVKVTGLDGVSSTGPARSRRGGGFLLVVDDTLRSVSLTGETTLLGRYKVPNDRVPRPGCIIEPSGTVVCIEGGWFPATSTTPSADAVVRYSFDEAPQVIYDDRVNTVKTGYFAELVSGP